MLTRLSLRVRVLLFFAALALGAEAALIAGLTLGYLRLDQIAMLPAFIQVGTIAGFVILGLVAWVWYLFDLNVAKPIEALAGGMRAHAHADVAGGLEVPAARYLGDLPAATSAVAQSLSDTRNALAGAAVGCAGGGAAGLG